MEGRKGEAKKHQKICDHVNTQMLTIAFNRIAQQNSDGHATYKMYVRSGGVGETTLLDTSLKQL